MREPLLRDPIPPCQRRLVETGREYQAVDKCPECPTNKLDLFQNAFEQLAPTSAGIISISYDQVACGITSPIVVRNKVGSSKYWQVARSPTWHA